MKKLLLILAFAPVMLIAQSRKQRKALEAQQKADMQVIANLKTHVHNLANRQVQKQALSEYIANQFKALGLQSKGTIGYLQPFTIDEGKQVSNETYLKINGNALSLKKEYFPLPFSAEKTVTGMPAMALREKGVPWFFDVKDVIDPSGGNSNINSVLLKEATKVASKGATALLVYNSSDAGNISYNAKDTTSASPIPVIYVMPEGYKKYFQDQSQMLDIELNVALKKTTSAESNVVGYIENNAPSTVVFAAHYNSVELADNSDGAGKIINSANENASGTALLIEIARMLATSKARKNNYLFIAFGGNDMGLAGSKHWLANNTIAAPANYLINLDMVGNYGPSKKLSIKGYGSSSWQSIIAPAIDNSVEVTVNSTAATDGNSPFYKKNIPVLHFSTASHEDYDKAADNEANINYEGELQIAKFINRLVEAADAKGKIEFAKTAEAGTSSVKN